MTCQGSPADVRDPSQGPATTCLSVQQQIEVTSALTSGHILAASTKTGMKATWPSTVSTTESPSTNSSLLSPKALLVPAQTTSTVTAGFTGHLSPSMAWLLHTLPYRCCSGRKPSVWLREKGLCDKA